MSNYHGNNMDDYFGNVAGPIGNDSFDETLQRQIEQFNQRLRYSADIHQHFLAALCAERVQSEVETLHDDLVRPPGLVHRVLRSLRAESISRNPKGTPTYETRGEQNSQHAREETTIIEGDFRVIEDATVGDVKDQPAEAIPISRIRRKERTHRGTR